jgi:hypothetical protein
MILHITCRGDVRVPLDPQNAIQLFTPEGERRWGGAEWDPAYPAGDDDTVFVTDQTVWITTERSPLTRAYARLSPHGDAGTVTVRCRPDGDHTTAEVTYDLTALSPDEGPRLERFAAGYDDFLAEWERAIAEACR